MNKLLCNPFFRLHSTVIKLTFLLLIFLLNIVETSSNNRKTLMKRNSSTRRKTLSSQQPLSDINIHTFAGCVKKYDGSKLCVRRFPTVRVFDSFFNSLVYIVQYFLFIQLFLLLFGNVRASAFCVYDDVGLLTNSVFCF